MRANIYIGCLIASLSLISHSSCKSQNKTQMATNCCDSSRKEILVKFANVLNSLVLNYKAKDDEGLFDKENCRLIGTFIWDITDTLKKETSTENCIEFKEGHIYHFAPIRKRDSYSNIAIITGDEVKIFKAVNCPGKGDRIEDAIQYIRSYLPNTTDKESIIERVINYRNYGVYTKTDEQSEFKCK